MEDRQNVSRRPEVLWAMAHDLAAVEVFVRSGCFRLNGLLGFMQVGIDKDNGHYIAIDFRESRDEERKICFNGNLEMDCTDVADFRLEPAREDANRKEAGILTLKNGDKIFIYLL
jgi:hypothetical protein